MFKLLLKTAQGPTEIYQHTAGVQHDVKTSRKPPARRRHSVGGGGAAAHSSIYNRPTEICGHKAHD